MGMETLSGDIVDVRDASILWAINGDPDDTIWIPKSVILEGDIDEPHDDEDILVEGWWYIKNSERLD
jgi:hypothetical protein